MEPYRRVVDSASKVRVFVLIGYRLALVSLGMGLAASEDGGLNQLRSHGVLHLLGGVCIAVALAWMASLVIDFRSSVVTQEIGQPPSRLHAPQVFPSEPSADLADRRRRNRNTVSYASENALQALAVRYQSC